MRLPALLSRKNPKVHKNVFGHLLILSGSPSMLGAAALSGLSAMRSGAGLVTLGVPQGLNTTVQKKISPVIMTLPLKETKRQTLSPSSYSQILKASKSFDAVAIGPGLSQDPQTRLLIRKIIRNVAVPIVIDADALNAVAGDLALLKRHRNIKILTPHPGEMARLTGHKKDYIEKNRSRIALEFAKTHKCVLVLKGHRTVVASSNGKRYINKTGNVGMATAGSGDVLTGMIAAFLAQGLNGFDAAKYAVYFHGKAGDLAAKTKSKNSMIATDIIEQIPRVLPRIKKKS